VQQPEMFNESESLQFSG